MKVTYSILILSILFWNCSQKTDENSKYSNEIADLKESFLLADSNFKVLENLNFDTLKILSKEVNAKYGKIKEIYTGTEIDTSFEKTMLIARGQFTKKSPKLFKKKEEIEQEFKLSAKNFGTLKENLRTENLSDEKSLLYYYEEKNALMILNAEIVSFVEDVNNTIALSSVIIPKMDTLILIHDNQ